MARLGSVSIQVKKHSFLVIITQLLQVFWFLIGHTTSQLPSRSSARAKPCRSRVIMAEYITQGDSSRAGHVSQHDSPDMVPLLGQTHATLTNSSSVFKTQVYTQMLLHMIYLISIFNFFASRNARGK